MMTAKQKEAMVDKCWKKILEMLWGHPEKAADIERMFAAMDVDNSGDVSIDELSAGLKDLGLKFTKNQVEVWCEAVDANHDGTISLDEFTQAVIFAEAKFKAVEENAEEPLC